MITLACLGYRRALDVLAPIENIPGALVHEVQIGSDAGAKSTYRAVSGFSACVERLTPMTQRPLDSQRPRRDEVREVFIFGTLAIAPFVLVESREHEASSDLPADLVVERVAELQRLVFRNIDVALSFADRREIAIGQRILHL